MYSRLKGLAIFCEIKLKKSKCFSYRIQSVLCVPVNVDEPSLDPVNVDEPSLDPQLRGFIDFILSAVSRPLAGLATTGDQVISTAINGVTSSGNELINNVLSGPNPNIIENDSPPMIVEQDDDQLLDVLDALVDQILLDQPIGTTEGIIPNEAMVSHDEIDESDDVPVYLLIVE